MKDVMTLINEENESGKYEIFCSFDSEQYKKSYVIYTGYYEDENRNLVLNAGSYEQIDEDTLRIDRNLTQKENEMLNNIMTSVLDKMKELVEKNNN